MFASCLTAEKRPSDARGESHAQECRSHPDHAYRRLAARCGHRDQAAVGKEGHIGPGLPLRTSAPRKREAAARRAWQRMLSGRRLDLLDPSAFDIEIEDIAHGLARVARWNGQTGGAHIFSVAQHCLLVEALARAQTPRLDRSRRLAVLLHDAPEYVIGDMISPFKAVIGDAYKAVERRILTAIHLRFGLPAQSSPETEALIKAADRQAAYLEATPETRVGEAAARRFLPIAPVVSTR